MKVVIVIPTYNERENTTKMIETLAGIVSSIPDHDVHVLYVDDSSPDGTADVVETAMKKYPWLHLLGGSQKQGLGMAYARGMQYAMKELKADFLMEFDADFQHPPEYIPKLLAEINHGYDYIIASRYIKGGGIPQEWSLDRKFLSWMGNIVARILLIMPRVHDMTGSFKVSRVKGFMDQFDFSTLLSKQFAYKVHLCAYMVNKGAKVKEVPYKFANRTVGSSKYMTNEMKETLKVIFKYQMKNPKILRFLKFGIVGGTGFVIQTAFFEYFSVFNHYLSPAVATTLGGEIAIINNFIFNNFWTFRDYQITGLKVLLKFFQFNLTSLIAIAIQFIVMKLGETVSAGSPIIIQFFFLGSIIIVFITNYTIYNKLIWKTSKHS